MHFWMHLCNCIGLYLAQTAVHNAPYKCQGEREKILSSLSWIFPTFSSYVLQNFSKSLETRYKNILQVILNFPLDSSDHFFFSIDQKIWFKFYFKKQKNEALHFALSEVLVIFINLYKSFELIQNFYRFIVGELT